MVCSVKMFCVALIVAALAIVTESLPTVTVELPSVSEHYDLFPNVNTHGAYKKVRFLCENFDCVDKFSISLDRLLWQPVLGNVPELEQTFCRREGQL